MIPVRPYMFTNGILDPINRHMEKARRKDSKIQEYYLNELD